MQFESLGLIDYERAREIQESAVAQRIKGEIGDRVYFCEHPPVVTIGRRGGERDLLLDHGTLRSRGIAVHKVSRGGETTFHAPGQLVIYPVISLREAGLTVREFVLGLLSTASGVFSHFGLSPEVRDNPAGVFVGGRKLAAVGLQISRGVSNHGMSVNVRNDLNLFSLIVPCGRSDISASSLSAETGSEPELSEVESLFRERIGFGLQ